MSDSPAASTSRASGRLPELDSLRFVAAGSVVLYHYTSRVVVPGEANRAFPTADIVTRFGYLGVTLFFMISGFVILWSSQTRSASEFVVARIARLYPSFWVCALLTTIVVNFHGPEHVSLRTLVLNLTMIPQPLGVPLVDGGYWTLLVELEFYALVFFVLITGTMAKVEVWLWAWLLASIVAATGATPKVLSALTLYPYGPYFISGCMFFLIRTKGVSASRLAAAGIACVLGARYAVAQQLGFMRASDVSASSGVVVAGCVILFHAVMLAVALRPSMLPESRWWYRLGGLTYPLYLLHGHIGRRIWLETSGWSRFGALAIELIVAFALTVVVTATIERQACTVVHKKLMNVGLRLRIVRPARVIGVT